MRDVVAGPCMVQGQVSRALQVLSRAEAAGGASRACRVLGACAAARRGGDGPPFVSTWMMALRIYTILVQ